MTKRLSIDPRGLAALRIALGVLLLADLVLRSRDLVVFYADAGVLPRSVLRQVFGGLATFSFLHGLSGSAYVQGLLFAVAGLAAVALLLGYRTRMAAAVSFLLLLSLHARNPVLLNAGDSLLRRLLFWGLFLPLGSQWSVDAMRAQRRQKPVVSMATVAILSQVVIVYVVNGVLKLRGEAWLSGKAIRMVFQLDHLTVRLGDLLAEFPILLEGLGWLWLAMLLLSPLLILLKGWPRMALVGLFASMHLGMALTMRLGLFPFISIAALLPFVPLVAWTKATNGAGPMIRQRLDVTANRIWLDRTLPQLPRSSVAPPSRHRVYQVSQLLVAALLVFILFWNAAGLGYTTMPAQVTAVADPTERRWDMFAPAPRTNDGWFVAPGELASGVTVDAYARGQLSWDRPPELARTFRSHRWFVYMLELSRPGSEPLREAFADYLCRQWNAGHDSRLVSLRLVYVQETVRLDEPETTRRIQLGRYDCPSG